MSHGRVWGDRRADEVDVGALGSEGWFEPELATALDNVQTLDVVDQDNEVRHADQAEPGLMLPGPADALDAPEGLAPAAG